MLPTYSSCSPLELLLRRLLCILANKFKILGETPPSSVLLLAQLFPHHIEAHGLLDLVIVAFHHRSIDRILKYIGGVFLGDLIEQAEKKL